MMFACSQARACTQAAQLSMGLLKSSSRTYYKKPFFYEDKYFGRYDKHDREKYPRSMHPYKEEELLDAIHAIRALEVKNPSPFHVITRVRGFNQDRLPWGQKVTLRRLNIHSESNGDIAVVPNTPQFNSLINKVKHLINLKPAIFADGKMPTEDDIGALKVCPMTGVVKVDEKLRLRAKRVNTEKPILFQGNHLRSKIARQIGIGHNHYMK